MSSSAFLSSLRWMHSYACIYQQIFQLNGLYQVRIPVKTSHSKGSKRMKMQQYKPVIRSNDKDWRTYQMRLRSLSFTSWKLSHVLLISLQPDKQKVGENIWRFCFPNTAVLVEFLCPAYFILLIVLRSVSLEVTILRRVWK
jgi:hypothetical protein